MLQAYIISTRPFRQRHEISKAAIFSRKRFKPSMKIRKCIQYKTKMSTDVKTTRYYPWISKLDKAFEP